MDYRAEWCDECKATRMHFKEHRTWVCVGQSLGQHHEGIQCSKCYGKIRLYEGRYSVGALSYHPACWNQVREVVWTRFVNEQNEVA